MKRTPLRRKTPLKNKKRSGFSGSRRDKIDAAASLLHRLGANWKCRNCGDDFSGNHGGLDWAHVQGRRHRRTRWHPLGAVALCKRCHAYYTSRPIEWAEWCREKLGPATVETVKRLSNVITNYSPADRAVIYANLRESLDVMERVRAEGVATVLSYASPYPEDRSP